MVHLLGYERERTGTLLALPPRRSPTFVITMETLDFRNHYGAMTDGRVLNLATDSGQLSPEARSSLECELSRRGIGRAEVDKYDQDRNRNMGDKKYNPQAGYSIFPTLRRIRATLDDWRKYRHQTGGWPLRHCFFFSSHWSKLLL
jgi:hypothetical protein